MIRKEKDGVEWLEFEKLAALPGIAHGVFLRKGGKSQGAYASLNAGGGSGDDPQTVEENREIIREILGVKCLSNGKQVHGDHLAYVSIDSCDQGECDGLLTQEKGIGLMIKHADCQAALFYDPEHRLLANVHCGWRGNVQNIYRKTVYEMKKRGTDVKNLIVCISPSLGPDISEFKNYQQELPPEFLPFQFKPLHFNLWEISRKQLLDAGVREENIEIAGICTYTEEKDFFSYRRDKITGRNATVGALL